MCGKSYRYQAQQFNSILPDKLSKLPYKAVKGFLFLLVLLSLRPGIPRRLVRFNKPGRMCRRHAFPPPAPPLSLSPGGAFRKSLSGVETALPTPAGINWGGQCFRQSLPVPPANRSWPLLEPWRVMKPSNLLLSSWTVSLGVRSSATRIAGRSSCLAASPWPVRILTTRREMSLTSVALRQSVPSSFQMYGTASMRIMSIPLLARNRNCTSFH